MSPVWLVVLVLALGPLDQGRPTGSPSPAIVASQQRDAVALTGQELGAAVRTALRRWARPGDSQADQAATDFLALYEELQQDRRLPRTTREQLRQQVRARLLRLADQITRRGHREKQQAARSDRAESVKPPPGRAADLAQRAAWSGPGVWGGPGAGGFAGGPPPNADYGDQLVDLIRGTVAPSSWDTGGGLGSIYYWRPGRALVVRQTDQVHGQISDTLEQLHRLNR